MPSIWCYHDEYRVGHAFNASWDHPHRLELGQHALKVDFFKSEQVGPLYHGMFLAHIVSRGKNLKMFDVSLVYVVYEKGVVWIVREI